MLSQPSTVNPTDRSTTIKYRSLLQKEKLCKNHLRHDDYQDGTTHTEKRMSFPNELWKYKFKENGSVCYTHLMYGWVVPCRLNFQFPLPQNCLPDRIGTQSHPCISSFKLEVGYTELEIKLSENRFENYLLGISRTVRTSN